MSQKKVLFLEIFQPFAQYRNPFTFYYAQSYPLPPKSTIIGMLQNAIDKYYDERLWNLEISVHGGFESVFWNYQSLIKGEVKLGKFDGRLVLYNQDLPLYGRGLKSQRSPINQQELFNGHLYIFMKGEKNLIEEIKSSMESPKKVLSLGRSEDVFFIKNVEICELTESTVKKNIWLTYPTYIKSKIILNREKKEFPIKNKKYPVFSIPVEVKFIKKKKEENNNIKTKVNVNSSHSPSVELEENNNIKTKGELTKTTERKVKFETVIYTGLDYVIYLRDNSEIKIEKYEIKDKEKIKIIKIIKDYGWL